MVLFIAIGLKSEIKFKQITFEIMKKEDNLITSFDLVNGPIFGRGYVLK